jgi:predicted kinase
VRGKVESFKLDDPYIPEKDKEQAAKTAEGYYDLAAFYARAKPTLFVTVGVTGTGKTTLSRALARQIGLAVISSDVVRKQLAGIPATEHRRDEFDTGIYSADFSRRTYDTMLAQARDLLSTGTSIVLDATFIRSADRQKASDLAATTGAELLIIECALDENTIRQWLSRRARGQSVSDGREEILEPQQRQFEPVTDVDQARHVVIDMSQPMETRIRRILQRIGES